MSSDRFRVKRHDRSHRKVLLISGLEVPVFPLVLQKESDEIVAVVKKNDVRVEYVLVACEGHGFNKKK